MKTPPVRQAISRIKSLPTLPSVLGKVLDTASDPDASALDLGQHIAADQSLSAAILRLVNSAYYGFYREITSTTTAIVILGFVEVRNLVLAATAFKALSGSGTRFTRTQLWRHSLATAMAAERCARLIRLPREGGHFITGLLHDMGKVALDLLYPEQFQVAAYKARHEGLFIRETEHAVFDIDHTEAGGILAEHWNLPAPLVQAIGHHHDPERSTLDRKLTCVTAVADFIVYNAGLGDANNGRAPDYPGEAACTMGITEKQASEVCEGVSDARDRIEELLGTLAES